MEEIINPKEERRLKAERKQSVIKMMWIVFAVTLVGGLIWWSFTAKENKKIEAKNSTVIVEDDYIKGNPNAKVTLIEYLDFECEACKAYFPLVKKLESEFPEDLRIVRRYYPLPGHRNGLPAALAVEAVGRQGKYNEMHDVLFMEQDSWGNKGISTPEVFEKYAEGLGVDMIKFKEEVGSQAVKDRVQRDIDSGKALGNTGTPSFYLNGQKINNPRNFEDFKTLIEAEIIKTPKSEEQVLGEKVHEHADLAVYLDGKKYNFTLNRYQSFENNQLNPSVHLHDGNGEVIHKHRKGVTLAYFFKTIGMKFDKECFIPDDGKRYCNTEDEKLKMYVNGKENNAFGDYEFSDLDRILITIGYETDVTEQVASVTDLACMYSEKCPERGTPPTESCVGGLGTEC